MTTGAIENPTVVPFGKYKGQPVELLLADTGYREWAMAQPWFRERYPAIYQVVINYGCEPVDTPEHNAMQASFLDDDQCLRLAAVLYLRRLWQLPPWLQRWAEHLHVGALDWRLDGRRFESGGWDVQFNVMPAAVQVDVSSLPLCTCVCDHVECGPMAWCKGGRGYCAHWQHTPSKSPRERPWSSSHCHATCPWNDPEVKMLVDCHSHLRRTFIDREPWRIVHVELKPDLGDDFPAVLRQVMRYDCEGRRCVVVRRHGFECVTWEQVEKIFRESNVSLIDESRLMPTLKCAQDD